MYFAIQNKPAEWHYTSGKTYADPFNDVELDVLITSPDGSEQRVPAFWAGDHTWRVRYSSPQIGQHQFRTECSDTSNANLHGQEGILEVAPYTGSNVLFQHGRLRVAAGKRHLEHQDGTPFFWLGDTWWMAFCKRMGWPHDFRELAADRAGRIISSIKGLILKTNSVRMISRGIWRITSTSR
jgi:hypothetical protein